MIDFLRSLKTSLSVAIIEHLLAHTRHDGRQERREPFLPGHRAVPQSSKRRCNFRRPLRERRGRSEVQLLPDAHRAIRLLGLAAAFRVCPEGLGPQAELRQPRIAADPKLSLRARLTHGRDQSGGHQHGLHLTVLGSLQDLSMDRSNLGLEAHIQKSICLIQHEALHVPYLSMRSYDIDSD